MSIKLKSIKFGENKFRKLQKLEIIFSDRITVIGGLNGIGKSTILGLIANCSGIRSSQYKSYFNALFQANFQELFHLDEKDDYKEKIEDKSYIDITYLFDDIEFTKRCSVSRHSDKDSEGNLITRLKVVPRTLDKPLGSQLEIGESAKVPLPTLYLGMSRMTPIGEYEKDRIRLTKVRNIEDADKTYIHQLFKDVITFDVSSSEDPIIDHDFKGSKKRSKLPSLKHNTFSISLGQDSLSSIFTALASFKKLKREMDAYPGGLLIIDEIDAGLHHIAQIRLMHLLKKEARRLNLQIVFTTHSLTIFKHILTLPESQIEKGSVEDTVVYLHNTPAPKILINPNYLRIKNNQLSQSKDPDLAFPRTPKVKIYLEDDEGKFFLEKIFSFKNINDFKALYGAELNLLSLKVGCSSLMNLFKADKYFSTVVIVPDNDILSEENNRKTISEHKQFCPLPSDKSFNENTPSIDRNPEKIIYDFLNNKIANYDSEDPFWEHILDINDGAYDFDYIQNTILPIPDRKHDNSQLPKIRDKMKYWFNIHKSFIENAKIIESWCLENTDQVDNFCKDLQMSIAFVCQDNSTLTN